jgi:hypothetical protein
VGIVQCAPRSTGRFEVDQKKNIDRRGIVSQPRRRGAARRLGPLHRFALPTPRRSRRSSSKAAAARRVARVPAQPARGLPACVRRGTLGHRRGGGDARRRQHARESSRAVRRFQLSARAVTVDEAHGLKPPFGRESRRACARIAAAGSRPPPRKERSGAGGRAEPSTRAPARPGLPRGDRSCARDRNGGRSSP